jgi:hypothetical protein
VIELLKNFPSPIYIQLPNGNIVKDMCKMFHIVIREIGNGASLAEA